MKIELSTHEAADILLNDEYANWSHNAALEKDNHARNLKKLLVSGSAFRQGIEKEVREELRDIGELKAAEKEIAFMESMREDIPAGTRIYANEN